ncbi:hypothetical protein VTL71DRAFT_15841 [Oculimacula yallundae]|uniref:Zn(2)-C6 fungal-type domain-containing protein n=1 Tax=Oculimacula yallundae TaxID=86028 RepID=A0ABR4CCT5_9HELO
MVFKGRMSRGCENCRKLHTKCDEKRPACSRCVRTKKPCTGYRDESDLIFRHTDPNASKKSLRSVKKDETSLPNRTNSGILSQVGCERFTEGPSMILLPPEQDRRLCYFYQSTMDSLVEADHTQYLHAQLPILVSRSKSGSVLQLATEAISLASWGKSPFGDDAAVSIRTSYTRALSALAASIRDPIEAKSDETLYAALLLEGYETMTFNQKALPAWGTHVDGSMALVKNRGSENFSTPLSRLMFLFVRRSAIQSNIQTSRPVDPIFEQGGDVLSSYENFEDRLVSKTMRVIKLQAWANQLLAQPSLEFDVEAASELLESAQKLDDELGAWPLRIPAHSNHSAVINIKHEATSPNQEFAYVPKEIHRYPSLFVARIWNQYRVSRLILQSTISRVSHIKSTVFAPYEDGTEDISQAMVDGICASVPFLLGYNCSELKHLNPPAPSTLWPQSVSTIAPGTITNGRFSLMWPLFVASSVPSISELQRRWIRDQLKWLANTGLNHANFLMDASTMEGLEKTHFVTLSEYGLVPQAEVELKLSPLDMNMPRLYGGRMTFCFPLPTDADKATVFESLKKTLAHTVASIPWLSGDVGLEVGSDPKDGRIQVVKGKGGVNFVYKDLSSKLPSYAELKKDNFTLSKLATPFVSPLQVIQQAQPVFAAQATFISGGLLLTIGVHHAVCDAAGQDFILETWALNATALSNSRSFTTYDPISNDRTPLIACIPNNNISEFPEYVLAPTPPSDQTSMAPPAGFVMPPMTSTLFTFSPSTLEALKASAKAYSTHDAILGFFWHHMSIARNPSPTSISETDTSAALFAVNIRGRTSPPLPQTYLGNASFGSLTPRLSLSALTNPTTGLSLAATSIRSASKAIHAPCRVPRTIGLLSSRANAQDFKFAARGFLGPDITASSWADLRVREREWGSLGRPEGFRMPYEGADGNVIILPRLEGGGLEVVCGLEDGAMERMVGSEDFRRFAFAGVV